MRARDRSRWNADIRSRWNADIEEGAISTTLVQSRTSRTAGARTIAFDPKALTCPDPEAQAMFTKRYGNRSCCPSPA
jgi:hypothetical protein